MHKTIDTRARLRLVTPAPDLNPDTVGDVAARGPSDVALLDSVDQAADLGELADRAVDVFVDRTRDHQRELADRVALAPSLAHAQSTIAAARVEDLPIAFALSALGEEAVAGASGELAAIDWTAIAPDVRILAAADLCACGKERGDHVTGDFDPRMRADDGWPCDGFRQRKVVFEFESPAWAEEFADACAEIDVVARRSHRVVEVDPTKGRPDCDAATLVDFARRYHGRVTGGKAVL